MNQKILDDAKAAGFDVSDEQISVHGNSNDLILNNMMAKFAALQIPEGYRLVPIEATDAMIEAAMSRYKHQSYSQAYAFKEMHRLNFLYDYKAMIEASPKP